jgi:hypothetical protein
MGSGPKTRHQQEGDAVQCALGEHAAVTVHTVLETSAWAFFIQATLIS